jgi:mono/diheme cytochrome c family protein
MNKVKLFFAILLSLIMTTKSNAHGKHPRDPLKYAELSTPEAKAQLATDPVQAAYGAIQEDYVRKIQPIFEKKCADCHSATAIPPWYAKIPIVSWIINSDRSEGQEHLEISKGFPFGGHGNVSEDLDSIKEEIEEGEMPTFLYKLVHPQSRITDAEKAAILDWVMSAEAKITESQAVGVSK